jgi:hypothetical protein
MGDLILVAGAPAESSIIVETRSRTRISNVRVHDVGQQQITADQRFRARYAGPGVTFRTPGPTGIYNCNGMTFASRRTQIWEPAAILRILAEDGHQEMEQANVLQGDTVVYFGPDGDPIHSGIVVGLSAPPLVVPIVCSKWANLSEAIHPLGNCPYMEDTRSIKFYRVMA